HALRRAGRAAAGGWIGSALEYYDFFIYATAASLVFPQVFFPSGDPAVAIVASLRTYVGGYVARPHGPSARSCSGTGATRTDGGTCWSSAWSSWVPPRRPSACCPPTRRSA